MRPHEALAALTRRSLTAEELLVELRALRGQLRPPETQVEHLRKVGHHREREGIHSLPLAGQLGLSGLLAMLIISGGFYFWWYSTPKGWPLAWDIDPWLPLVAVFGVVITLGTLGMLGMLGMLGRALNGEEQAVSRIVDQVIPVLEGLEKGVYPHTTGTGGQKPLTALITVHGVSSDNEGFERLALALEQRVSGLLVYHVKYDEATVRKLSPEKRANAYWAVYNQFHAASAEAARKGIQRLFLVAHSFGTIATVHALQAVVPSLKLLGVALVGSALSRIQNWNWLTLLYAPSRGADVALLNIVRPFDFVVPFARFVDGGESGAKGFVPLGWRAALPLQTFKTGGHTSYPDDVDDLAAFVSGQRVTLRSRDEWRKSLGRLRRVVLALRQLV